MNPDSHRELWHQLWLRECDYWADVDLDAGRCAADYYTLDAVFDLGTGSPIVGRPAIAAFYRGRQAHGPRTSAHIVHNFAVTDFDATVAQTRAYVTLHAATGLPAISDTVATLVAVVSTSWELSDAQWLIARRTSNALFAAPGHDGPNIVTSSPERT